MNPEPDLIPSLAAIRTLFGAGACSCALVDESGTSLTFVAADGRGAAEITGVTISVSHGIAGWAVMSGQPLTVRDVAADERFARDIAEATSYVPTSVMVAPLYTREGEVLGVVEVLDAQVDAASDWTLAVLGTLGSQLAALIEARGRSAAGSSSRLEELAASVLAAVHTYSTAGD